MTASFDRLATVTASTKRPPPFIDGKRGRPVVQIGSLQCWPLDPVDPEVAAEYRTGKTRAILQTMVAGGLDVQEGDRLVVGEVEYPIRAVADWHWPPDGSNCQRLILEQLKEGQ